MDLLRAIKSKPSSSLNDIVDAIKQFAELRELLKPEYGRARIVNSIDLSFIPKYPFDLPEFRITKSKSNVTDIHSPDVILYMPRGKLEEDLSFFSQSDMANNKHHLVTSTGRN